MTSGLLESCRVHPNQPSHVPRGITNQVGDLRNTKPVLRQHEHSMLLQLTWSHWRQLQRRPLQDESVVRASVGKPKRTERSSTIEPLWRWPLTDQNRMRAPSPLGWVECKAMMDRIHRHVANNAMGMCRVFYWQDLVAPTDEGSAPIVSMIPRVREL